MMSFHLIATCKLGLESVLKKELIQLGCQDVEALNGEVHFEGDDNILARCNLWLRTAERVFLELSRFPALSFDELFEGISEIYWDEIIPKNGKIVVIDKCLNSQLMSGRTVQSITKKAIVETLKKHYGIQWLSEDGEDYYIHVNIVNDHAAIWLDSSGIGLHKRGYRAHAGEAPLRETIAASMILLSGWQPDTPLHDPFCGAGTIAIEAAMIGMNMAPGLYRNFASENWPFIDSAIFKKIREEAANHVKPSNFLIQASDIDFNILKTAEENSKKAHVSHLIHFEQKAIKDFKVNQDVGLVIANPPYGERLEDVEIAEEIYKSMGNVFTKKTSWSYFILSPHPEFEQIFGRPASKNRKIYNGKIKCYLYQF